MKNRKLFLVSKKGIRFWIFTEEKKTLPVAEIFWNWDNFIKKSVNHKVVLKFKEGWGLNCISYFEIRKSKKCFFFFKIQSIVLFPCFLGYSSSFSSTIVSQVVILSSVICVPTRNNLFASYLHYCDSVVNLHLRSERISTNLLFFHPKSHDLLHI